MVSHSDNVELLCAADLHLGRRPSRVPSGGERLAVAEVWRRIVDLAVAREVDAVLLAGDVVDRENRYYEAFGPLRDGIRRLAERGMSVVAVGGNHDWDVLPRLAETIDLEAFHLLGGSDAWESHLLEIDGEPALEVCGWSFPRRHYPNSPLADREIPVEQEVPTVGLMHADLEATGGNYAPVDTRELERAGPDHWVLGHLHAPADHDLGAGRAVYPGSPQPLDPGESGAHGVALLEVSPDGSLRVERETVATLQYVEQTIDLAEVSDRDAFEREVPTRLEESHRERVQAFPALERIVYRLEFVGRTAVHRHLDRWRSGLVDDLRLRYDGVVGAVDRAVVSTRPTYDLQALARSDDPPGVLARLIRELEAGDLSDETSDLVRRLRQQLLDDVYHANAFAPLRADETTAGGPEADDVREMLVRQGLQLLDALMQQTGPASHE